MIGAAAARALGGVIGIALLTVGLGCSEARGDAPPGCDLHEIEETPLCMPFTCMEIGRDDAVYGWCEHTLWESRDRGTNWHAVRAFAETLSCRGIFVDRSGAVFLGISHCGVLWKGTPGEPWTWTTPLTFHCRSCADPGDNSRMWNMDEDGAGNLYVGEYGGAWEDTCAFIYRSWDGGDSWDKVYEGTSRHVHFVRVDPYSGDVYASLGDGIGRQALIRSGDGGAAWDTLYVEDCLAQPTAVAFTESHRVFGSDCGGAAANRIYGTADDDAFETLLLLTGEDDAYVWDMCRDRSGYLFAGTKAKLPTGSSIHLYASYDGGEEWCSVKDFGVLPEWCGVHDVSRFDSEGWGYYTCMTAPGVFSAYRFRDVLTVSMIDGDSPCSLTANLVAYPNPFPLAATIEFHVPARGATVSVRLYNLRGECVRTLLDGPIPVGRHEVAWDRRLDSGDLASSGVYFVEVDTGGSSSRGKLLVLR